MSSSWAQAKLGRIFKLFGASLAPSKRFKVAPQRIFVGLGINLSRAHEGVAIVEQKPGLREVFSVIKWVFLF